MSTLTRAGSRTISTAGTYVASRRTMLGLGALAAAGLATLAQRSSSSFGWTSRFSVTSLNWTAPLRHGAGLWHRSYSTTHGFFSAIPSIRGQPDDSAMASLTPPRSPPAWTHSPEDVKRLTKELIENDRKTIDEIAALAPEECNFDSVRPAEHRWALSYSNRDFGGRFSYVMSMRV
jgi:hypothetical protein